MPAEASGSGNATRILLHEITREEAAHRAARALVVLPVAATEQHGPHLPLGTDFLIVEHVARTAADLALAPGAVDVLVTPTLAFGSSHHHLPFGGTISIGTERYYGALSDMVASLIQDGFRRLFILNGHGGNQEVVRLVARDLALQHRVNLGAAAYWELAQESVLKQEPDLVGIFPGHAGIVETSLILALRPELVSRGRPHRSDEERWRVAMPAAPFRAERHGFWRSIDGYTDSPDLADAERGRRLLDLIAPALAETFARFSSLPLIDGRR